MVSSVLLCAARGLGMQLLVVESSASGEGLLPVSGRLFLLLCLACACNVLSSTLEGAAGDSRASGHGLKGLLNMNGLVLPFGHRLGLPSALLL